MSAFSVGSVHGGWKITALERDGSTPRYSVESGGRRGTLTVYPLSGPRSVQHTALGARLKRADGVVHERAVKVAAGRAADGFYVAYPTLDRVHKLGSPPLPPEEALDVVRAVGEALSAYEAKRTAHGEIDAWCVVRDARGAVALLPPGLRLPPPGVERLGLEVDPGYAAPEVLDQRPATIRSDMFSLGLVLYRLLTGKRPVTSKDPGAAFAERGKVPAPDLSAARLPEAVQALYEKLTAVDPRRRPQTCKELLEDVDQAKRGVAPRPREPKTASVEPVRAGGWLLSFLASLALAGGLYYVATVRLPPRDPLADYSFPLRGAAYEAGSDEAGSDEAGSGETGSANDPASGEDSTGGESGTSETGHSSGEGE